MIRMLVLDDAWGENDARPHPAQNPGQRDGMGRPDFQVGVSVELDELDRRAEERRGSPRFCDALLRLAMRRRFAARAHNQMRRSPGKRFLHDHTAASELDFVSMCGLGEQRKTNRWVARCEV